MFTFRNRLGLNYTLLVIFTYCINFDDYMNRMLVRFLVLFLLLSIVAIYVFIPAKLVITSFESVKCNGNGAARFLSSPDGLESFSRGGGGNGYTFRIGAKAFHEMDVFLQKDGDTLVSQFTILNVGRLDSIALRWNCNYSVSLNPLRRVQQYRQAVGIRHMMDTVLARTRIFLEKKENIYGMPLVDSMSKDSALLVIKLRTATYPSIPEIYRSVAEIREYIATEGAHAINYPMLHVSGERGGGFETIVGISVNRVLKGNGTIVPKRYVPWKIVVGEVRGGTYTTENAMVELQQYVSDHQQQPMGLPFQSMVTERNLEQDTSRWVTRVVQAVP